MKSTFLSLAVATLLGAPVLAVASEPTQMTADQAIAHAQWMYPGEVVAARYDRSDVEHPHYHVDMLFRNGKVVKFEVDAINGNFAMVPHQSEQPRPTLPLTDVIDRVRERFEGEVIAAEFDATTRSDPHYHIDVKLQSGHVIPVRMNVDGTLQWRETVARAG